MKDNFSEGSAYYARFRPSYPKEFFSFLASLVDRSENAWDCGTGNGQLATELAHSFKNVFATDISAAQLKEAPRKKNIIYSIQPAEKTNFESDIFDLITIGQAIHWFDFDKFYKEVRRTSRKDALICAVGYGRVHVNSKIDALIHDFYTNKIVTFWDSERRFIDEHYQTIPFPFEEIESPGFEQKYSWRRDHFLGYLKTWSAVRHFKKQKGFDPIDELESQLTPFWPDRETREVKFPILLRVGKIH